LIPSGTLNLGCWYAPIAGNRTPLRERVGRGIYKRKTSDGVNRYEVAYVCCIRTYLLVPGRGR
jgi:hypothetical protein